MNINSVLEPSQNHNLCLWSLQHVGREIFQPVLHHNFVLGRGMLGPIAVVGALASGLGQGSFCSLSDVWKYTPGHWKIRGLVFLKVCSAPPGRWTSGLCSFTVHFVLYCYFQLVRSHTFRSTTKCNLFANEGVSLWPLLRCRLCFQKITISLFNRCRKWTALSFE